MNREILVEILTASFPAFIVFFILAVSVFAKRKPEPPYLKRVAKKYSISPLNLG